MGARSGTVRSPAAADRFGRWRTRRAEKRFYEIEEPLWRGEPGDAPEVLDVRDEWLHLLLSRSDHTALPADLLDRLLDGVGASIDAHGGSFAMRFESVLITAARLAR